MIAVPTFVVIVAVLAWSEVARWGASWRQLGHGDATPGSAVRIQITDVARLQREFKVSTVYPLQIGLDHESWGEDLTVPDPFGNRIIFHTPTATGT